MVRVRVAAGAGLVGEVEVVVRDVVAAVARLREVRVAHAGAAGGAVHRSPAAAPAVRARARARRKARARRSGQPSRIGTRRRSYEEARGTITYVLDIGYALSNRFPDPPQTDYRRADVRALRHDLFCGDVYLADTKADRELSTAWGWVPVLDFAWALCDIVGAHRPRPGGLPRRPPPARGARLHRVHRPHALRAPLRLGGHRVRLDAGGGAPADLLPLRTAPRGPGLPARPDRRPGRPARRTWARTRRSGPCRHGSPG